MLGKIWQLDVILNVQVFKLLFKPHEQLARVDFRMISASVNIKLFTRVTGSLLTFLKLCAEISYLFYKILLFDIELGLHLLLKWQQNCFVQCVFFFKA